MVLEGTLGLTASHFILDFLRERDLLPGFVDGYGRIASDEQRHIAYGTWFLREAVAADPAMADVIRDQIKELLPGCGRVDRAAERGRLGRARRRGRARWRSSRSARSIAGWR